MTINPYAGEFYGREHRLPVRVYYEDTDFTRLVYHASYVRFLERGRSDFLRLAGADHVTMAALGVAFVITRLQVRFSSPARIDDALMVCTTYDAVQGARILINQRILRGETLLCAAEIEAACIGLDGRSRRPPKALSSALRPWIAPQAEISNPRPNCGTG